MNAQKRKRLVSTQVPVRIRARTQVFSLCFDFRKPKGRRKILYSLPLWFTLETVLSAWVTMSCKEPGNWLWNHTMDLSIYQKITKDQKQKTLKPQLSQLKMLRLKAEKARCPALGHMMKVWKSWTSNLASWLFPARPLCTPAVSQAVTAIEWRF